MSTEIVRLADKLKQRSKFIRNITDKIVNLACDEPSELRKKSEEDYNNFIRQSTYVIQKLTAYSSKATNKFAAMLDTACLSLSSLNLQKWLSKSISGRAIEFMILGNPTDAPGTRYRMLRPRANSRYEILNNWRVSIAIDPNRWDALNEIWISDQSRSEFKTNWCRDSAKSTMLLSLGFDISPLAITITRVWNSLLFSMGTSFWAFASKWPYSLLFWDKSGTTRVDRFSSALGFVSFFLTNY